VLVVLAPMGVHQYASGTAQAVLDFADPGARLVFSCGWHITRDGHDVYSWKIKVLVNVVGRLARLARIVDLDDQVEACRRVFASDTRWTVVRGSDLEEGESQGLPVWSRHVGDPILASNITRRVDFALFMVAALENDELVHEARRLSAARRPLRSRIAPGNKFQRRSVRRGGSSDGQTPLHAVRWCAHLVGALRVYPHKHWANYPPPEDRGCVPVGRVHIQSVSANPRTTRQWSAWPIELWVRLVNPVAHESFASRFAQQAFRRTLGPVSIQCRLQLP
jgi:hypothetical protein